MKQIFDIPLRTFDGGKIKMQNVKSDMIRKVNDLSDHFLMNFRFPDYSLFSYFFASGFKLRLNQSNHLSRAGKKRPGRQKNFGQ